MPDKVRILFVTANPPTSERLRVDKDVRDVTDTVRRALKGRRVKVIPLPAARPSDLRQALREQRPQVVHFSGHGGEHGILLEDHAGRPMPVSGETLGDLFDIPSNTVRLVVLSACESQSTAAAFQACVDFTVAMKRRIIDRAAITFNTELYAAIADGETVPNAFRYAVSALRDEHQEQADIPELLTRPGASEALTLVGREPKQQKPRNGISIEMNRSTADDIVVIDGDGNTVG